LNQSFRGLLPIKNVEVPHPPSKMAAMTKILKKSLNGKDNY
jgi:hypothetical protein